MMMTMTKMGKRFKNKHIWGDLTVAQGQNLSSSFSDGEAIDYVNINVPAAAENSALKLCCNGVHGTR